MYLSLSLSTIQNKRTSWLYIEDDFRRRPVSCMKPCQMHKPGVDIKTDLEDDLANGRLSLDIQTYELPGLIPKHSMYGTIAIY